MQARLFETFVQNGDSSQATAVFRDSAFGKNKDLPIHRWVPWVAGFSADFVEDCIEWYIPPTKSRENVWVLDPFAGVGTTLVESYRRGLNVIGHYPRNTRPQLHWLGFATQAGYGEGRETDSFGKFWQTVRGLPSIDLTFSLPELSDIIDRVRKLNVEKGTYGGAGWANYIATYFNDTYRFCGILKQLLDRSGVAVIVIGNSIIQGVEVKTDQLFGKIGELCGLKFEDNWLLRKKRTGSSIIQSSVRVDKATEETELYESAIVLRNCKD